MKLHLEKELFKQVLDTLSSENNIDADILEKDYYVCCVLKELAKKQDSISAYFKGGTAIYKILDTMNRFSEDIDLTIKGKSECESNNKYINRIKDSAKYQIEGLTRVCEKREAIGNNSLTEYYQYKSVCSIEEPLQRAGNIQIETTSFTVSEPIELYTIEPLIYKLANEEYKKIFVEKYDVGSFEIKIIKIERMFIDKIFAAEFYYIRGEFFDTSKHLYDIAVLYNHPKIQNLLNNQEEMGKLVDYKRSEEKSRNGGIGENVKIKDFTYLADEINKEVSKEFKRMQNKYIFKKEYILEFEYVKNILNQLLERVIKYDF